jgi:hypothetical protein
MPDLGLQAEAKNHFDFLITEKGYKCAESTPHRVRFESSSVFVEIVFDGNRSCELALLVGKAALDKKGQPPFSIDEIVRLRRAPETERFSLIQITSREALARFVEKLARLLRTYASDLLDGSVLRFAALLRQRNSEVKRYAVDQSLRIARAEAEAAWYRKDYEAVIKAIEPFRKALIPSEIKKLSFSKKHCGNRRK